MHSIRQKCRPKHQVLVLKCYPRTTKGAVDVKPNSSELSYLLYYATTRRSKVQKVCGFLEKKTASDVWRARIGYVRIYAHDPLNKLAELLLTAPSLFARNVQVTLQILAALVEKAPRDLPLYAPYVLKILSIILRSRDITMVESSIPTFEAFCGNHDGATLSADQEYLRQYEEIVRIYASFAVTTPPPTKPPTSAPVAMRWRNAGLQAIKSVASSEALASLAGKQLDVVVPILLENLWAEDEQFLEIIEQRAQQGVKVDAEKPMRRRTSVATVRTVETTSDAAAAALSATAADADKLAEENIAVLAMQCLQQIFVVPNRIQIHGATTATLEFISGRVTQRDSLVEEKESTKADQYTGWASKIFELIARWTPVQDRYVILVTTMEILVQSPVIEDNLQEQLVLATMVDSLLKSDINMIGLSVMDVLLGLIHHVVKLLQLSGTALPGQQMTGSGVAKDDSKSPSRPTGDAGNAVEAPVPSVLRRNLLNRLQECVGDLATHIYYADQISDMVSTLLMRLKPSPPSHAATIASIENPPTAPAGLTSVIDLPEDQKTDGFFLFGTAKVKALEAIKLILHVASHRNNIIGGAGLGRNRVPVGVWEGTQWLLRDSDGRVRKAYVDVLLAWLETEVPPSGLRVFEEKPKNSARPVRNDSSSNLTKRAVSNASQKEKSTKPSRTTFLQLLHLAIYENALQYVDSEADILLLHLLLTKLVDNLGVNAVKSGLPMVFRLQEDILEAETPLAKVRIGSLCHGYFWAISEKFDIESSPVGRAIDNEIQRRRSKKFWVERTRFPPVALDNIGTPGTNSPQQAPVSEEELESEELIPFDERFQMVKLISLSYAESMAPPPMSAPTSPNRSFSQPILSTVASTSEEVPEKVKDEMMSGWSREAVIATAQEGSKSASLNGSRSGTAHRSFLAVNGNLNTGGTNSRTHSPPGGPQNHLSARNKPESSYGLVRGLGALQKLRKGDNHSPSPATDSSRNSVTRVDQLKMVLSRAPGSTPVTRAGIAHSDSSSESMVSYDFTASELSFNPPQQDGPRIERSVSLRERNGRARSKSRDRIASGDHRPLTSHPMLGRGDPDAQDFATIPPVPPLPQSLMGDGASARRSRSLNQSARGKELGYTGGWAEDSPVADLESLLKGIDTAGNKKGHVAIKPPY
ncbi:Uncharacterized protein BP5553_00992 [Venustampulla echinocandica]|uniref:Protein EFR3 n=1 Tax=Venustampulla echinocandica TaxID=2656787 RepID=A0A370TZQ4_9HELO|nr:Uncharacterized protein BP5553_00992 [Venustampulla echinocandica]RDL41013.1 Uncharacterized protein BP5553_00992 [Venustampulla echinocandica]